VDRLLTIEEKVVGEFAMDRLGYHGAVVGTEQK
jgi:hypothetical protein